MSKHTVTIKVRGDEIRVTAGNGGRITGQFVVDNNSLSVSEIRKKCIPYIRREALFLCDDVVFCDRAFLDHKWRVWLATFGEEKSLGTEGSCDQ